MARSTSATARAVRLVSLGIFLFGCAGDVAGPSVLSITAGDGQSGVVGTQLANPLVIKVVDAKARAVAGLAVTFRVTKGGGSVLAGTVLTDDQGMAQDYWTLGTSTEQTQTVEVRSAAASGQTQVFGFFSATALPAAPANIAIQAGEGQSASPGTTVPIPPAVRVRDQYGNPVPAHSVSFAVTLGGGSITGAVTTTNGSGVASVGSWTLGPTLGQNSLSATAAGSGIIANPVIFSATAREVWTIKAAMPTPRHSHAVDVVNGILYAVGGQGVNNSALGTVEAYDPATNSWTIKAPMPTARWGLSVGVVNGILYAVGGNPLAPLGTVEAYDPATNSWTTKAPLPTPRGSLALGVVNGILYAVGGWNGSNFSGVVEAYDPATNSWTTKAPMPTPRTGFSVGVVNGTLYAVSGQRNDGTVGTVEAYDPATNSWTTKASMPTPRTGFSVGVVNGILYGMGGRGPFGTALGDVEAYDPAANSWTTQLSLPTARHSLKAGVVNGILYAVGGVLGNSAVGTNEAWRP